MSDGISSTLDNGRRSGFVATPTRRAEEIVFHLLSFPKRKRVNVIDWTVGEGDLLLPCLDVVDSDIHLYGTELSEERAARAREQLPNAHIVTADYKTVHAPRKSMSLVLANFPYFFEAGVRAEYNGVVFAGEKLVDDGVMAMIIPVRSAWKKGSMIYHWAKYYYNIRCYKFPDSPSFEEEADDDALERALKAGDKIDGLEFLRYTQVVIIGNRHATPLKSPDAAEVRKLLGWTWTKPKEAGISPWGQGFPPPDLPTSPLADPYVVPVTNVDPTLLIKKADEADLLRALWDHGAHRLPQWQEAITWRQDRFVEKTVMPPSSPAHLASVFLTGILDKKVLKGPDGHHYVMTSFVAPDWKNVEVDEEEMEEQRKRGVISMSVRQQQDKAVIGVLCLESGEIIYYQGDEVFAFLEPWLPLLTEQILALVKPLYHFDPTPEEARAVLSIGWDKQLPKAEYPGLSDEQAHMVIGMARALDVDGRVAIMGEPGVGKTRLLIALMHAKAYIWHHRNDPDQRHVKKPIWLQKVRRAWLNNAQCCAWLDLEKVTTPMLDATTEKVTPKVTGYCEKRTGKVLRPEQVGPKALPLLVATPRKVVNGWKNEFAGAWPEAEVVVLEDHYDVTTWMKRCSESDAPAVVGLIPLSLTRAFGVDWHPAVLEKQKTVLVADLDPGPDILDQYEPLKNGKEDVVGYVHKENGSILKKEEAVFSYSCPSCGREIQAVPVTATASSGEKKTDEEDERLPVGSITWFTLKQRYCDCEAYKPRPREVSDEELTEEQKCGSPLWKRTRWEPTTQKFPGITFEDWARVMEVWQSLQMDLPSFEAFAAQRLSGLGKKKLLRRYREAGASSVQFHLEKLSKEQFAEFFAELSEDEQHRLLAGDGTSRVVSLEEYNTKGVLVDAFKLIAVCEPDTSLTPTTESLYEPVYNDNGKIVAFRDRRSHHILLRTTYYLVTVPPEDSFSPYEYLYRMFKGCVAVTIIDESHNARGRSTDIARAVHFGQLAAHMHCYASGTHYGGKLNDFYYYWFRFWPAFWRRLGLGWEDAEKAMRLYGVVQEVVKERESDARKGSGQTDKTITTRAAPGISAKLIPYLLACMVFLTVLDVGAFMPDRIEIPELVPMPDPVLKAKHEAAEETARSAAHDYQEAREHREELAYDETSQEYQQACEDEAQAVVRLEEARLENADVERWINERDLSFHYDATVRALEEKARKREEGSSAAQITLGTLPALFAALPFDPAFEVYYTPRDDWGNKQAPQLIFKAPILAENYLYPLELRFIRIIKLELEEERRIVVYVKQNKRRDTSRRLQWVLREVGIDSWILPNSVKAENREEAIREATRRGHKIVFVMASRVNEGINLQDCLDSIIWYEMPMNLFLLDQAGRRLWRLNRPQNRAVRVYYLVYAGTAAHRKLRSLALESGAAAAFQGEPPKGALVESVGANRTMLARLSQSLHDMDGEALLSMMQAEEEALQERFIEKAMELRKTLDAGRPWIGVSSEMRHPHLFQNIRGFLADERTKHTDELGSVQEDEGDDVLMAESLQPTLLPEWTPEYVDVSEPETGELVSEPLSDHNLTVPPLLPIPIVEPIHQNGHRPFVPAASISKAPIEVDVQLTLFGTEGIPVVAKKNGKTRKRMDENASIAALGGASHHDSDLFADGQPTWDSIKSFFARKKAANALEKAERNALRLQATAERLALAARRAGQRAEKAAQIAREASEGLAQARLYAQSALPELLPLEVDEGDEPTARRVVNGSVISSSTETSTQLTPEISLWS